MPPKRVLAYAAIFFLWGGSFLAIRDIVVVTPPFFAAAFRFLIAGLLLYGWARLRGAPRVSAREWAHSLLMGIVMFGGNYACLFWAEQRLDSGIAAVLTAMVPVWIFLGEWLFFRTQRLAAGPLAGIVLGIYGVVLLCRASAAAAGWHSAVGAASAILILGTLLFAVASLWSRKLTLPAQQTMRAGLQMLLGGMVLILVSAAAGEFSGVPAALRLWRWHTAFSMVYLIFAASILAFTAYTWLLHHDSATRVSSYAYVNPLVALVVGAVLAHERLSVGQWAGALLVILGVFATLVSKPPERVAALAMPPPEAP